MVRPRFVAILGLGLICVPLITGCYGNPFEKGDGSGVGTGRPSPSAVDAGKTGGLGSTRDNITPGPAAPGRTTGTTPSGGAH